LDRIAVDDLRSLESFLKTVEAGSFSAAAGRLGLTPAAVSKHVAKLERELSEARRDAIRLTTYSASRAAPRTSIEANA